jgi:hypothetical protein
MDGSSATLDWLFGLESVVTGSTVSLAWGAPSAGNETVVLVQ